MAGIGRIFTPLPWARWAVREFGLLRPWLDGASVFDPTMGDGVLLEALVLEGLAAGVPAAGLPADRLYGVDLEARHIAAFRERMRKSHGIVVPADNLTAGDFLFLPPDRLPVCDILFGNPPWMTFADLPAAYKGPLKEKFLAYGLVETRRKALLGNSRADIAGLVAAKALADNLRPRGKAVFFLPLSLFASQGANAGFLGGRAGGACLSAERIIDLTGEKVFPGVATRYCAALLSRTGAENPAQAPLPEGWEPVPVRLLSRPRQGVNTCGANDVFFFDVKTAAGDGGAGDGGAPGTEAGGCVLANSRRSGVRLPENYVFPLATAENFREETPVPRKWVFLPYRRDGKPLTPEEVRREPLVEAYLAGEKTRLENRKGVLLRSNMRGGCYWALLGVGPYSFGEWKILWEAYGRREWRPKIFPGRWQANQALQCGMTFSSREDCLRVFDRLSDGRVERYLRAFGTLGGMNWAQPGKIQKLLSL